MKKPSLFALTDAGRIDSGTRAEIETDESRAATKRPPSREGKRVLSIYLPPEAWKQLRMLAVNLETSTQDLGEQAINMLFETAPAQPDRVASRRGNDVDNDHVGVAYLRPDRPRLGRLLGRFRRSHQGQARNF